MFGFTPKLCGRVPAPPTRNLLLLRWEAETRPGEQVCPSVYEMWGCAEFNGGEGR